MGFVEPPGCRLAQRNSLRDESRLQGQPKDPKQSMYLKKAKGRSDLARQRKRRRFSVGLQSTDRDLTSDVRCEGARLPSTSLLDVRRRSTLRCSQGARADAETVGGMLLAGRCWQELADSHLDVVASKEGAITVDEERS